MTGTTSKKSREVDSSPIETDTPNPVCGVVMPIANFEPYPAGHWAEVLKIIGESAATAGFSSRLVSDSPEVGVIQKRIIQNLYDDEIVVCDVSGRNPNVMFEMGVRLTFDKPTVIIQDELTAPPFDTSIIEYLTYPSDLSYYSILEFKDRLSGKLSATYKKSVEDKNYSTFLRHFGEFRASHISTQEIPGYELILKQIQELRDENRIARRAERSSPSTINLGKIKISDETKFDLSHISDSDAAKLRQAIANTGLGYVEGHNAIILPGISSSSGMVDSILKSSGLAPQAIRNSSSTIEIMPF